MAKEWVIGGLSSSGKTTLICTLIHFFQKKNQTTWGAFLPFETGISDTNKMDQTPSGERLHFISKNKYHLTVTNPYIFYEQFPIEYCFQRTGQSLNWDRFQTSFQILKSQHERIFIECPVGLFNPITEETTLLDWLRELQKPILWLITPEKQHFTHHLSELLHLAKLELPVYILINNINACTDSDWLKYVWQTTERITGFSVSYLLPYLPLEMQDDLSKWCKKWLDELQSLEVLLDN